MSLLDHAFALWNSKFLPFDVVDVIIHVWFVQLSWVNLSQRSSLQIPQEVCYSFCSHLPRVGVSVMYETNFYVFRVDFSDSLKNIITCLCHLPISHCCFFSLCFVALLTIFTLFYRHVRPCRRNVLRVLWILIFARSVVLLIFVCPALVTVLFIVGEYNNDGDDIMITSFLAVTNVLYLFILFFFPISVHLSITNQY